LYLCKNSSIVNTSCIWCNHVIKIVAIKLDGLYFDFHKLDLKYRVGVSILIFKLTIVLLHKCKKFWSNDKCAMPKLSHEVIV
jgi:hypothetical protein